MVVSAAVKPTKPRSSRGTAEVFANGHNEAAWVVESDEPYMLDVTIQGTAKILFSAWHPDIQAEIKEGRKGGTRGGAPRNADPGKMLEAAVYRTEDGMIGLPGVNLHRAIQNAAKNRKDPRSPRKSAFELYKVAVIPLTEMMSFGVTDWAFVDSRRTVNQFTRGAQNTERPGLREGWTCASRWQILLPGYITPKDFYGVLSDAGLFSALGAFRPTFGRFQIVNFNVVAKDDT